MQLSLSLTCKSADMQGGSAKREPIRQQLPPSPEAQDREVKQEDEEKKGALKLQSRDLNNRAQPVNRMTRKVVSSIGTWTAGMNRRTTRRLALECPAACACCSAHLTKFASRFRK